MRIALVRMALVVKVRKVRRVRCMVSGGWLVRIDVSWVELNC